MSRAVEALGRLLVESGLRRTKTFARPSLFEEALTQSSWANLKGGVHYERLELLGDAVLGLVVAEALFEAHPTAPEGVLTRLRASLVDERSLAAHALGLDLGRLVAMDRGEERTGGRERKALLADTLEAVVAALYLSEGFDEARDVVRRLFAKALAAATPDSVEAFDAKSALQVRVHALSEHAPRYLLVTSEGPSHAPSFVFDVEVVGVVEGRGEGRTKKAAQQAAAEDALRRWDAIAARLSGQGKA